MTAPPQGTTLSLREIRGGRIAVWDRAGGEPAFVLLHGNGASKEAFRPLFESRALADHRLIAFDLPGSGGSSDARDPEHIYTLTGLGDVIVETIDAFDPGRYVLVGWSLGGHLAIEALLHGAIPEGVVLSGTPPCGPDPAEIAETFLPVPGGEFMQSEHPSPDVLAAYLTTVYAPTSPSDALRRDAERADGRMRTRLFAHIFATPDLEPQRVTVANWKRPIALVQGRGEPFFDPAKLEALTWGNLWRGSTQWIDGAGHAPFISHPEAYGQVLKSFAGDLGRTPAT